jgi:uncharacterized protein with von Willebrand factor type A (vWA) domain
VSEDELPLYELFIRLRAAEFPLGVSDYNLLLEVLLANYSSPEQAILNLGIPKRAALKQLCQTLWVKSVSQRRQFEAIFDEVVAVPESLKPPPNQEDKPIVTEELYPGSQEEQSNQDIAPDTRVKKDKDKVKKEYFIIASAPSQETSTPQQEEIEVAKALRMGKPKEWVSFKPSGLKEEYFPVTAQQMKQEWYEARGYVEEGVGRELDIAATIDQIKRRGKFFHPVQKPRQLKSSQLVLLIDQKGSMQPFHVLSRLLVETALQTGCLEKTDCYYFNNYPRRVFYNDAQFQTESPVAEVIARLHPERTVVLIFSDGGAARGDFILRRILKTIEFLKKLQQHTKAIVWLNPIPQSSWKGTTAEAIANEQVVQMFEANFSGFHKAIRVLQ